MNCNMCGREDKLYNTRIEGTVLQVCKQCGQYGKIISAVRDASGASEIRGRVKQQRPAETEKQEFVVENYAGLVRAKRGQLGLDQEEFAKKVNEKLSVVSAIESGKHAPSIGLARKIGRFLKIRLVEEVAVGDQAPKTKKRGSEGFTIGDMIKPKG